MTAPIYLIGIENFYHASGARWAPTSDVTIDDTFGYFTERDDCRKRVEQLNINDCGNPQPEPDPTDYPASRFVLIEVEPA